MGVRPPRTRQALTGTGTNSTSNQALNVLRDFDVDLTTHVTHSDAYRATTYMDAKDGWYGNTGGNVRAGLQGGDRVVISPPPTIRDGMRVVVPAS